MSSVEPLSTSGNSSLLRSAWVAAASRPSRGRFSPVDTGQRLTAAFAVPGHVDVDPRAVTAGVMLHDGAHHFLERGDGDTARSDECAQAVAGDVHCFHLHVRVSVPVAATRVGDATAS